MISALLIIVAFTGLAGVAFGSLLLAAPRDGRDVARGLTLAALGAFIIALLF